MKKKYLVLLGLAALGVIAAVISLIKKPLIFEESCDAGHLGNWEIVTGTWNDSKNYFEKSDIGHMEINRAFPHTANEIDLSLKMLTTKSNSTNNDADFHFLKQGPRKASNGYKISFYFGGVSLRRRTTYMGLVRLITGTTLIESGRWYDIRVTRDATGQFELFLDGVSQGTAIDTTFNTGTHFVINGDTPYGAWDSIIMRGM